MATERYALEAAFRFMFAQEELLDEALSRCRHSQGAALEMFAESMTRMQSGTSQILMELWERVRE